MTTGIKTAFLAACVALNGILSLFSILLLASSFFSPRVDFASAALFGMVAVYSLAATWWCAHLFRTMGKVASARDG